MDVTRVTSIATKPPPGSSRVYARSALAFCHIRTSTVPTSGIRAATFIDRVDSTQHVTPRRSRQSASRIRLVGEIPTDYRAERSSRDNELRRPVHHRCQQI